MINFVDEKDKIREDENSHLAQMAKTPGFKVLQKMAKEFEEMNLKNAISSSSNDDRTLKLGEISGMRKLLNQVVSRSESEAKPPSWTEK